MSRHRRRRRSRRRTAARAAAGRMFSDASTSHDPGSASSRHPIPVVLTADSPGEPDRGETTPELAPEQTEVMMEPDLQDREASADVPERPEQPAARWIPAPQGPAATTAAAHEPPSDELLYRAARQAEVNGEHARAIGVYRELLVRYEGHVAARANLAQLLGRTGQPDAALVEFATCLSHDPDNTEVLVYRAELLATETRYAEAESDLHTVLGIDPGNVEAHYHLGLVLSRKGRWADATPYLRRAIELDSSRASAYFYLGEALNHVDDLDGALRCYQRAAELRPNDSRALYGIGIVLDRLNRPDDAAQMYRRSREILRQ